MTRYYKTDNPAVLAINAQIETAKQALLEQSRKVGEVFNARPIYCYSIESIGFGGLALYDYQTREDRDFWTKPNRENGRSVPRTGKVKGKGQEQADLLKKYGEMTPKKVDFLPLFEAMGVSWGNLLFSGYTMFFVDEVLYFGTSAPVGEVMTEIMGSEFDDAKIRHQKAQKAA